MTDTEVSIRKTLEVDVGDVVVFSDGFSFTTGTELDAYKAAYKCQFCRRTEVRRVSKIDAWLIQVYR